MSVLFLGLLLVLVMIIVTVAVATVAIGASAVRRNAARKLEVAPGVPSAAPPNWVGAHTEEATLHRRLVTATSSLRRTAELDPSLQETVAGIEAEAVRLDAELVAAADLAPTTKAGVLVTLDEAVRAIESLVERAVVDRDRGLTGPSTLAKELEAFDDRIAAIRQAWIEIDELDPPGQTETG